MALKSERGFSLLEMIVYLALAAVTLAILTSLFVVSKNTQTKAYSSYLVGGRFASAIATIRRDLQATALASLQAYPNSEEESEAPGLTAVSAYAHDNQGRDNFEISPYGVPRWVSFLHYTVVPNSEITGHLLRWRTELPIKNGLPALAEMPPALHSPDTGRALIENVLLANVTVSGIGKGGSKAFDEHGGFEVKFIRRAGGSDGEESFTPENPRLGEAADNTRLVQVTLRTLQNEKTSNPDYFEFSIRVAPRY